MKSKLVKKIPAKISAIQKFIASFLIVIAIGTFLLNLSISQTGDVPISFFDCFFTSVSATCVTGLITVTTVTAWSLFGKFVILGMIQIGGLSFITIFGLFLIHSKRKITLENRLLFQVAYNQSSLHSTAKMVLIAIRGALVFEAIGAVILTICFRFSQNLPWLQSIWYGVFHSVSSFCNAEFDIDVKSRNWTKKGVQIKKHRIGIQNDWVLNKVGIDEYGENCKIHNYIEIKR